MLALTDLVMKEPWWRDAPAGDRFARLGGEQSLSMSAPRGFFACLIDAIHKYHRRPLVIFAPTRQTALEIFGEIASWRGERADLRLFAEADYMPAAGAVDDANRHLRLTALNALLDASAESGADADSDAQSNPPIVIVPAEAICHKVMSVATFRDLRFALRQNQNGDKGAPTQSELVAKCVAAGYRLKPLVDAPGGVSRRGDIVDIFPANADQPIRLEFFGDFIESVRRFDPETQRSIAPSDLRVIAPATEIAPISVEELDADRAPTLAKISAWSEAEKNELLSKLRAAIKDDVVYNSPYYNGFFNRASLFDYLPPNALKITLNLSEIKDNLHNIAARSRQLTRQIAELDALQRGGALPFHEAADFDAALGGAALDITQWGMERSDLPIKSALLNQNADGEAADIVAAACDAPERRRVVVASIHAPRLMEQLNGHVDAELTPSLTRLPSDSRVAVAQIGLRQGFALQSQSLGEEVAVLTDAELFGYAKRARVTPRFSRVKRPEAHLEGLKEGMFVVHEVYGVGKFRGTRLMSAAKGEYLVIEYAANDKIFVPVAQIGSLEIYRHPTAKEPKLSRLHAGEWTRAKARVRQAAELLAGELLAVAASRRERVKTPAEPDTPWQVQLETAFEYEETPDQARAIAAVKQDMESRRPMDRLVCGDTGYGKTEVALRAAFKAVCSGVQVAVLTPTTLLAKQHRDTFAERLKPFPVTIEALYALNEPQRERAILNAIASGGADIVIGTHRLIQADVKFKNLGLLIIDEEHRFGVAQKERLKKLRADMDVISLSATPIPRTLNMALSGVCDMSAIETPPQFRLPSRTFVLEYSENVIREAILRELNRGGQIFSLHNRVRSLNAFAERIHKIAPEARIVVAHGQMEKTALEDAVERFRRGEYDILACTTIIEAGIDMPNVNTLIVENAHQFGLAQLYQLRGRVGRGTTRGYAYFLLKPGQRYGLKVHERLDALMEATDLGAGFKIAMRDLQIRGAGNLLGAEQSGHMAAVGVELYTRILKQALRESKAKAGAPVAPSVAAPIVELNVAAAIPASYIENAVQRFNMYRRIAQADAPKQIADLRAELRDRFGATPKPVETLLNLTELKVRAAAAGVKQIRQKEDAVVITFHEPLGGARGALQKALQSIWEDTEAARRSARLKFAADEHAAPTIAVLLKIARAVVKFRDRAITALASERAA